VDAFKIERNCTGGEKKKLSDEKRKKPGPPKRKKGNKKTFTGVNRLLGLGQLKGVHVKTTGHAAGRKDLIKESRAKW